MNAEEGKSINKASKRKTATRKGPKQGLKSVDFARIFCVLSYSKTVGRGFKSYCPCQKSKSKGLDFFVPIKSRKYITPLIAPAASELYRSTASAPTIIGSKFISALFGSIRRGNSINLPWSASISCGPPHARSIVYKRRFRRSITHYSSFCAR